MSYIDHACILYDISQERDRQEDLCTAGKFDATLASGVLSPAECLSVIAEEFGEVSMVVADQLAGARRVPPKQLDTEHLREELIQLAACCVAWVEALDRGTPAQDSAPSIRITEETDMGTPPSGAWIENPGN